MQQFKKSFYGQSIPITIQKYEGLQYTRFAIIFPGQGSLNVQNHAINLKKIIQLKKYIQIVDDFLESKLESKTIWYLTDHSKIKKNEYATIQNLFLFSLNVAYFDFLIAHKNPDILTAHSFGEYAAIVCSGVLSFEQMLEVVFFRETLSPEIGEIGTLIATHCSRSKAQSIATQLEIEIANINSLSQTVFAVSHHQLKAATNTFKKYKIAYRVLDQVGRPYHSQLMLPIANKLKSKITELELNTFPSKFQLLSSVSHHLYPVGYRFEKNELIDLLTEQLTTPVDFPKIIQQIRQKKINSFLDLSQVGVYQQFISDILQSEINEISNQRLSQMYFVDQNTKSDQLFHLDLEKNPFFKTLSKYISQVTGYELVEIGINDYFQEDLRIDSIKKAEIVFKTLQETNLNIEESLTLAQLRRVGDVVKYLEQRKENPTKSKFNLQYNNKDFHCFTFGYRPIQSRMPVSTNQISLNQMILDISEDNQLIFDRLVQFWNQNLGTKKQLIIDFTHLNYQPDIDNYLLTLLNWCDLVQNHFPESSHQNIHTLLTCYSTCHGLLDLPFVQFFRAIAIELGFRFQWVQDTDQSLEFDELANFYDDEFHEHIKIIDGNILTSDFQLHDLQIELGQTKQIHLKHVLAIGGANGLCFEILQRQKEISISKLTIVGRTSAFDLKISRQLKTLTKKYEQVEYVQCDCIDLIQLKSIIEVNKIEPFDLIINAAGVEKSEKLINKSIEQIKVEFLSKIAITDNLVNVFKNTPKIHFSSIVGLIGNEGQSIYSLANAWQAELKRRYNETQSKVVFWPAIDQVGMTKNPGLYQKMKASGIQFLKIEQATHFFEKLACEFLINKNSQSVCIAHFKDLALLRFQLMDWNKWAKVWGQLVDPEKMIFQHRFSIEESSYLADHRFETMSVIPASLVVSQLICYGIKYLGDQFKINQLSIHNMLMILPGKETIAHAQYYHYLENNQQSIEFHMFSQLEHFSAKLSQDSATKSQHKRIDFQEIINCDHQQVVELNSFYSRECIDFGFKFQVFEKLVLLSQHSNELATAVGTLKDLNIYYQGETFADRIVMIIEAAFQTASMIGVVEGQRLGIPLSIREVLIHQLNFNRVYCLARPHQAITKNQDEPMSFNIQVIDENNQLVLEINELVISPIRSHPTLPFRWQENQLQHEF